MLLKREQLTYWSRWLSQTLDSRNLKRLLYSLARVCYSLHIYQGLHTCEEFVTLDEVTSDEEGSIHTWELIKDTLLGKMSKLGQTLIHLGMHPTFLVISGI